MPTRHVKLMLAKGDLVMKSRRLKAVSRGWASIFDLSGSIVSSLPDYENGPERDGKALHDDWTVTGKDIRRGIELVMQA